MAGIICHPDNLDILTTSGITRVKEWSLEDDGKLTLKLLKGKKGFLPLIRFYSFTYSWGCCQIDYFKTTLSSRVSQGNFTPNSSQNRTWTSRFIRLFWSNRNYKQVASGWVISDLFSWFVASICQLWKYSSGIFASTRRLFSFVNTTIYR